MNGLQRKFLVCMAIQLLAFFVNSDCPCAANVITSVGDCNLVLTDFSAGMRLRDTGVSWNKTVDSHAASARSGEFRDDVIGLTASFPGESQPATVFGETPFDELKLRLETNDVVRFMEWQIIRTGGIAAYKAYEVGSTGDLAITQIVDTLEYEKGVLRGRLRARQIIPGLSEFSTSGYFRSAPLYDAPNHSDSSPMRTRIVAAPIEGQRL